MQTRRGGLCTKEAIGDLEVPGGLCTREGAEGLFMRDLSVVLLMLLQPPSKSLPPIRLFSTTSWTLVDQRMTGWGGPADVMRGWTSG